MNEILRLLQRSLRPFGYDIRRRGTYNLLPFKGLSPKAGLDGVRRAFDYDGGPERCAVGNLDLLKIVYRTCLNHDRNLKASLRVSQAPLVDTVERCFYSLVRSVNAALKEKDGPRIEVLVLDDHSDADLLARIENVAAKLKVPWKIQTTEETGQGASLHEQFALAAKDDALYYFCEDDYLHEKQAIYEMAAFYKQIFQATRRHLILHPQEHETLYDRFFYPSYLLLSPYRHWRTVSDATHQLFMHSFVVRDYWAYFENTKFVGNKKKRKLGSEAKTTNRLFDHLPCFSPIPALAAHMQAPHVLPPFFDWRKLWAECDPSQNAESE